MTAAKKPVILFDGVCNLCTRSVQLVLRHDKRQRFQFASLQSRTADQLTSEFLGDNQRPDSFVLIQDGHMYTRSTAALRVARQLSWPFPLLYAFVVIPVFIRDGIYNYIAKNRFRWFGKKASCWLPNPELSARFLDRDEQSLRPLHGE